MRRLESILITVCLSLIGAHCASARRTQPAVAAAPPRCGAPVECQRVARRAYDAEMARGAAACRDARTQVEDTECEARSADVTERDFALFYGALESLVGAPRLRASQEAWLDYRKRQCDAIFELYRGGTIAPSAESRCLIDLTRSRMRDLETLYDGPLHR